MPSYKITPTENERIDTESLREGIEATSGTNSNRDPRSGTIPDTFRMGDMGVCWVQYGREDFYDRPTWEGIEETLEVDKYPLVFLQNGYVAHGKAANPFMEDMQSILQEILNSDISFEPIEFDEDDLHKVIEQASKLQEVNVAPSSRDDPDYLAAGDRKDLRDTTFWEDHQVDPFEKIRVQLPDRGTDVDVGFDDDGTVILYGRNMDMTVQARALRYLTDEIIDRYVDRGDFQGTIGRFGP